jgi:hypothetical protein
MLNNLFKTKTFGKSATSFWANDYDLDYGWDDVDVDVPTRTATENSTLHYLKLNAHRRAIANFVNILTNKNIPVKFNVKGDSYTDGKSVTISSDLKPDKFDSTVGLALHEASHIVLTDFETFVNYKANPTLVDKYLGVVENVDKANSSHQNWAKQRIWDLVKNLTNYVEDKRIDNHVYTTCPGYRDYYRSLYDVYFNDASIDKGLTSNEYTTETIDSYLFRIINITNPNSDLSKLRGLRKISKLLNLNNINRITSTQQAVEIAEGIVEIIIQSIADEMEDEKNGNGKQNAQNGPDDKGEGSGNGQGDGEGEGDEDGEGDDDLEVEFDDSEDGDSGSDSGPSASLNQPLKGKVKVKESEGKGSEKGATLSEANRKKLEKAIQKQKDFLKGETKKKSITNKDDKALEQIAKSGTELVNVAGETIEGVGKVPQTQVVVVKRLTEELMLSENFPLARRDWRTKSLVVDEQTLQKGLALGNMLGKRLQVRSEERDTVYNRQLNGRIDRRLVSALGYDYQNVFYTKEVDKFKKVILHISLDASGSMAGDRWRQAMTTAIALCKAATMVNNLDVQLSVRSTIDGSGWNSNKPYMVIAYDSRTDKFAKVKQLVAALEPNGTTPEGLCFEAIMKHFTESTNDLESYFLNISDGEPNFGNESINYSRDVAVKHTAEMVKRIKQRGIGVLSYFVSDYTPYESSKRVFSAMYGKDAKFIDVNGLVPITKTLNELFLKK